MALKHFAVLLSLGHLQQNDNDVCNFQVTPAIWGRGEKLHLTRAAVDGASRGLESDDPPAVTLELRHPEE